MEVRAPKGQYRVIGLDSVDTLTWPSGPLWKDCETFDEALDLAEFLPTDDPEARLFAAESSGTWSAMQISRTHARWSSSEILTPALTSFYFPFRLRSRKRVPALGPFK
jgi:hypothetical protein